LLRKSETQACERLFLENDLGGAVRVCGRWRSVFSSRLHARILPRLTAIGPSRNLRIQRGVRRKARQVQLTHWHNPWMAISGWEIATVCIDSMVQASTPPTLSRRAHSQTR